MQFVSKKLPLLGAAAIVSALFVTASSDPVAAAASNPLFDYESATLSQSFTSHYSGVSGATVNVDVPYGLDDSQKYDVYLPASRNSAPIIVMIHGGDWVNGDKQDDSVASQKAAYWVSRGYIFVSLNYRLLPKSDPLIQAADVALAIANIQKNAPDWGGSANKVVLMGAGSGGHLAALLSSNPSLASDQGASAWAGAVILETPALNIPAMMNSNPGQVYTAAFGSNLDFWEDSSPAHIISSSGVPMMVVCSTSSGSCTKASEFKSTANSRGVHVNVSQQPYSPSEISANLGASSSYTTAVATFIDGLL